MFCAMRARSRAIAVSCSSRSIRRRRRRYVHTRTTPATTPTSPSTTPAWNQSVCHQRRGTVIATTAGASPSRGWP
ncbi:hypothetical protein DB354_13175 [Opitutus sp. ER46]|nr:hypothetical protein DB354_13175 [Opitutus sp. ER46]